VDCDYVVSSSDPVFARLEHHKSHEYSSRRTPSAAGVTRKRRGRPPKFAEGDGGDQEEMTEDEMRARAAVDGPSSSIVHGFVRYTFSEPCPDRRCAHHRRPEHFHCVRARCHDVEVDRAALVAHDRDVHRRGGGGDGGGGGVRVADGFVFFGADVDCRRARCRARRGRAGPTGLRHFHCVRPRCDYAFVRQSTMTQHEAKHRMSDNQRASTSTSTSTTFGGRQPVPIVPRPTATAPVTLLPTYAVLGDAPLPGTGARSTCSLFAGPSTSLPTQIVSMNLAAAGARGAHSLLISGFPTTAAAAAVPLSTVLQPTTAAATLPVVAAASVRGLVSSALSPSVIVVADETIQQSQSASSKPVPSATSTAGQAGTCGRPFCTLKQQRDHVHCGQCDVAFVDVRRLAAHLSRAHADTPTHLGPTDLSCGGSASTSTARRTSSPSSAPTVQSSSAAQLSSTVISADDTAADSAAERYDNDNDNDNGRDMAIDLTSPVEGRSSSDV